MDNALGHFEYVDGLVAAVETLQSSGYHITVFSPVPLVHELEHMPGGEKKTSPLKYFTFFGGAFGFLFGIQLVFATSALYVLPRGGRAIWSLPPALLIAYETTILLGVLCTLLGFIWLKQLPSSEKKAHRPEFGVDSFGLLVEGVGEDRFNEVEKILKEYGATEVKKLEK